MQYAFWVFRAICACPPTNLSMLQAQRIRRHNNGTSITEEIQTFVNKREKYLVWPRTCQCWSISIYICQYKWETLEIKASENKLKYLSIFPKRYQYFPTLNTLKHKNRGIRSQFSFRNCLLKFSDCELTEILECQLLSLTAGTSANHCPPKLTTKLPNLSKKHFYFTFMCQYLSSKSSGIFFHEMFMRIFYSLLISFANMWTWCQWHSFEE